MWKKISSLSLGLRVAVASSLLIALVLTVNSLVFIRDFTQSAEASMVEQAKVFTSLADETKNHVSKLHKAGVFDEAALTQELKESIESGRGYKDSEIFKTIPVVAGWMAAAEAAKREHIDFDTPAFDARNKDNEPKPGSFTHDLLRDLASQVERNGGDEIHRVDAATNSLHYMRAIKLDTTCMSCHGDPATSPSNDGKDITGFAMENWKAGSMHGAFHVTLPLEKMDAEIASFVSGSLEWSFPLFIGSGAFLFWLMRRMLSKPIRRIVESLQRIASRDLTSPPLAFTTSDEVGKLAQAADTMSSNLTQMISDIRAGTSQIDAGGTQIASASQSLAQGASEQASSLEQISASVEQISGQTQQAAENARQAATLAEESKKSADRGQHEMIEMNKAVGEIKQSSAEISKIIKVIDEIAFQTNLLALNAAVEAARAGEAGKGFAVVAEEVRNLAQRSAEAAKNTSGMIEQSVKRSENGVAIASRVGTVLEEITSATSKVNALLAEIASASGEQATGIGQVNQGVSQLDQVTQQTAGNSEQLASSAEELSSQVASLNDLVNQFKVGENADSRASAQAKPKPASRPASKPRPTVAERPKSHAASANSTHAKSALRAEQIIPLESDETLASF